MQTYTISFKENTSKDDRIKVYEELRGLKNVYDARPLMGEQEAEPTSTIGVVRVREDDSSFLDETMSRFGEFIDSVERPASREPF